MTETFSQQMNLTADVKSVYLIKGRKGQRLIRWGSLSAHNEALI